eukprot:g1429.t1
MPSLPSAPMTPLSEPLVYRSEKRIFQLTYPSLEFSDESLELKYRKWNFRTYRVFGMYVTFILGSISLLYLFVNLSLCYDWPMRDKGPSVYYTGSTGSCGEMYFNETCFEENKEHVYVYYRWHIGFHVLSCIGFFTGFTMLKSRRCRSRVFNFETQRESNIWQYYAFCLNLYVANVYMELHNFLVQEYNQYSNRVGFSLGVGFATTIITMATFSNLRMWFAVSSIWISTIHLCILYAIQYGVVESVWFCLRVVVLSVMLSLLCVNVEILKRWNFANMCRLARAKMKAEPFSVNSLRQFLFNSKMEDVDMEESSRHLRRGRVNQEQEMPSMINFFKRRTPIRLYNHGRTGSSISSASTDTFSPLSEWSIDWRGINRVKRVAAGAGGLIFRADFYTEPVALKQISSQVMDSSNLDEFSLELSMLARLSSHPGVVRFLGITKRTRSMDMLSGKKKSDDSMIRLADDEPGQLFLVLQWCEGGDLSKQIARGQFRGEDREAKILRVLREIAATFSFIHSLRVVHRDLKPRNVLIDRRGRTQICDFGAAERYSRKRRNSNVSTGRPLCMSMSRSLDEEESKTPIVSKLVGTPAFVAPEMILAARSGGFSAYRNFEEASKGDVYAFGILMAALVSEEGKELYDDVKFFNDDFLKEVSCGKRRPVLPKDCPKLIRKWAPKCWHQDPAQRPDFVTLACAFDGREVNEYGVPSRRRSASMTDNTPPRRLRFSLRRPRHALSLSTIPRVRMDSSSNSSSGNNTTPTVDRIV